MTISILSAPNSIPSHVIFVYLALTLLRTCSCCFHVTSSCWEWGRIYPSFLHCTFLKIDTAILFRIFRKYLFSSLLFSWFGWWDPQQWSEELGSEISLSHLKHTSSVFSAWQTHFPDSSPFNWTVFADHSIRGNISFYNFYNFNGAVWNRYQLVIISQNI